jgi:hypothetical protein
LTKCAAKTVTPLPPPLPPSSARDQPVPLPKTVVGEDFLNLRVGGGGVWGCGWRVAGVSVAMLLVISLRCLEFFFSREIEWVMYRRWLESLGFRV